MVDSDTNSKTTLIDENPDEEIKAKKIFITLTFFEDAVSLLIVDRYERLP